MPKTPLLAAGILAYAGFTALCQTTLNFCTAVDKDYCYFNNTQFISPIDSAQALIFIMVRNPNGFNTSGLIYKIFSIDKNGEEKNLTTLTQESETDWTWAWKSFLFPTPGKYVVKLYNRENQLLKSNSFELFLPKK